MSVLGISAFLDASATSLSSKLVIGPLIVKSTVFCPFGQLHLEDFSKKLYISTYNNLLFFTSQRRILAGLYYSLALHIPYLSNPFSFFRVSVHKLKLSSQKSSGAINQAKLLTIVLLESSRLRRSTCVKAVFRALFRNVFWENYQRFFYKIYRHNPRS